MNIFRKRQYSAYWNIGFCWQTPEEVISKKKLKPVRWLKHPYRDRWFADPFVLRVSESEIVVFVEECPIEKPKGIICELVIDRKTMLLKHRYVLLELDTHLSYPAIIRYEGKVYVYPENGASGKLNLYEYDSENHKLINPICILDESVADATILQDEDKCIMLVTKYPETQENAYLYESKSLFGPFVCVSEGACQPLRSCARPGGNWIHIGDKLYRPAQDCSKRYGGALVIMKVIQIANEYQEEIEFRINPLSVRYSRGVHTINFEGGLCIVDGYGYLYQISGRLFMFLKKIKGFL